MRNQIWEAAVHAFDYASAEPPITKLRKLINNGRVDLRSISPRQLEQLVTSVFRDYYGCKAAHVGASRDGGIDVLLLDSDQPLAIQVKRRSTPETEGPAVIRELVGALACRGLRRGAFVTTAETFSRQARETASAEPLTRDGYEIDLYTYDALRSVIDLTSCPQRPWIDLVFDHYLSPEDVALKRAREAVGKGKLGQQNTHLDQTLPNSDA
ncbi:restriction endonuclease [Micromonospora matsumotoense]|uniref:restriction endonuclease n=1 Tax=Micromonospora matsumotoense TaxID=121616 RepID=UPI003447B369